MEKSGNNNKDENFDKYQARLSELAKQGNLVPPPVLPIEDLINHLIADGNKLLALDEKKSKDQTEELGTSLGLVSDNPYVRARTMILGKMSEVRKKEIAEMEKTGNVNNKTYQAFIAKVTELGDKLSK